MDPQSPLLAPIHVPTRLERWAAASDPILTSLAALFLAAYAWPILDTGLASGWKHACTAVDLATWAAFAVDYVVRVSIAADRHRFVRRHVPDLLIIALPLLRPLRLLRLVLLLRVMNRSATNSLRGRVVTYVAGATVLLVFTAALAVLDAERHRAGASIRSFGDALWWSCTTITTVGYGDRYPITTEGRFVAVGLMIAGIALLGVVTASIASWLIEQIRVTGEQEQDVTLEAIQVLSAELAELKALLQARTAPGEAPS